MAGSQVPVAAGLAFALKYRESEGVIFCTMGEGSMNLGVVHESFNLMALRDLPVVVVVENNHTSMMSHQRETTAFKDYVSERAEGYDMEWQAVEGWDIPALWNALAHARRSAAEFSRPSLVEVDTFRYFGTSVADAQHKKYRTPEEINFHREYRDPVRIWRHQLVAEGVISEEEVERLDYGVKQEAIDAVQWVELQPPPQVPDIQKDVYWEGDHGTEASRYGRYFF